VIARCVIFGHGYWVMCGCHIEETEAGLKGLYIREITTVIKLLIRYY